MDNPAEQHMMQIWLGALLGEMKAGNYQHVITELETALGIIEEDRYVVIEDEVSNEKGFKAFKNWMSRKVW